MGCLVATMGGVLSSSQRLAFCVLMSSMVPALAVPVESSDRETSSCRFISRISGDSGYGKNRNWQEVAKVAALREADRAGASHVVWDRFTAKGAFNGFAEGKLYFCGNGDL